MRIAYVTSGYQWPFKTITNEIKEHERAGWSVITLASTKPDPSQASPGKPGQEDANVAFRPNSLTQLCFLLWQFIAHPIGSLRMLGWLIKLLTLSFKEFIRACYEFPVVYYYYRKCKRLDIQHIHVHFASRSLTLALMINLLMGIKVSCTVHAFDIFTRSISGLRWRLGQCCFISAISNYNIEYLREHCGEDIAELCHLVHCGIDLKQFDIVKRNPQPEKFVCVANFVPKKGYEVAIRAFALLRDANDDFQFNIVGKGAQRVRYEKLIKSLHLENNVKLLGSISDEELLTLFQEASAFVMPCTIYHSGDRDGIPAAMMEALACQIPVISTWVSGIPELVQNNISGLLVTERDPLSLAEAIRTLANDPEKVKRFGLAGREYVRENFNIEVISKKLRTIIEDQYNKKD